MTGFTPPERTAIMGPDAIGLSGRVTVVTGAARGLGRATAELMARFGATVAVCDRDAGELATVAGASTVGHFDVRDRAACQTFVDRVVAAHGRIDVLVNNAGGTFYAPFTALSDNAQDALVAENFTHVATMIRAVAPFMPAGSAIVNVTSIEAHQAAPGFAIYAAMKAAVANLTRTLALELAPAGIRVTAIAPDAIRTGGEHEARAGLLAGTPEFDPAVLPPLGHFGTPDDAAALAVFLASAMARFITGVTVHIDGGTWAAGGWRRIGPAPGAAARDRPG